MNDLRKLALARVNVDGPAPRQLITPRNKDDDDDETEIKIYDAIDSWGDFWGVSADEISQALDEVDTPRIRLRINSPGGEIFEAVAIYNLFADHDAEVHVVIDALAASAASFIAMAGDTVTMNRGAEMMIHDAWGVAVGNAAEMRGYADILDRQTEKVARIYHARAGGPLDAWLEAMATETWYSADEAVEAGLADEAIAPKGSARTDGDENGDERPDSGPENRWKGLFEYDGRADAPDPAMPSKDESGSGELTRAQALAALESGELNRDDLKQYLKQQQVSTGDAPEAAPDSPAAVAAERRAATRQRRAAVDIARARLALASSNPERTKQ